MFILAFIGILFIFWYMSKKLKKLSAWLYEMSFITASLIEDQTRKKTTENVTLKLKNRKSAETNQLIKGTESDVVFSYRVRSEIDELEKEINKNP